ncbi:MAG: aldehyde dehydrogenase [Bacteroidales bacterium]|jgi:aldehyde dehydrogenase (NAD+)|nr:aldehyde dehydrogenase [Bacteroidales bacterium]
MINSTKKHITTLVANQRQFFATHQTKNVNFRIQQLKKFKSIIYQYEQQLYDALWTDLHKCPQEAFMTEISIVISEIDNHIKHLKKWAKPHHVTSPMALMPSKSKIIYEPLGVALIIAPWNYPFQLLMNSLVGAISAGCCAVLKASPYTEATAQVMENMVSYCFPPEYVGFTQGNREVNQMLLEEHFDVIMFTGSPDLGKIVMNAASKYLTPTILELGGKSPCIVDKDTNIAIAAQRIAWGKTINAGQTCIAPDYLFVHQSVKQDFIDCFKNVIRKMYGEDCQKSPHYTRIVNDKAVERLQQLMKDGNIVFGGETDEKERYIAPTLIDNVKPDFPIMQEEIFGPLLPMMTFCDINEVLNYVNLHEKPLAFYYFGKNSKEVLYKTTSGGACVNDTLMHIVNHHLPFGGVGNSGMGKYHGIESFMAFSNKRAVVCSPTWIDMTIKYAPYKSYQIVKKLM